MNAAICFFSYARDAELLDMALQAVPRLREHGHNIDVYLCNDGELPQVQMPSGCRVWQTTFDRKGNLNGEDCIVGMSDVYNSIFQNGMYEWVLKTDCDTFINSLDWLHGVSSQTHAFAGTIHVNDHCSGACYAVSRNGAEWLQSRFKEASWRGVAKRGFYEDAVLYNMCKLSGMQVHALRANDKPDGMLWHDWQGEQLPFAELQKAYAVDFKACRWNSKRENWEADRLRAIERMKNYIESLKK